MTDEKKKTESKSPPAAKPKVQERHAPKAAKAEATIYIGPTLRGGRLARSTIFRGGELPKNVADLVKENPVIKRLIVPVSKLGTVENKLKDPTTPEAANYAAAARLYSKGGK